MPSRPYLTTDDLLDGLIMEDWDVMCYQDLLLIMRRILSRKLKPFYFTKAAYGAIWGHLYEILQDHRVGPFITQSVDVLTGELFLADKEEFSSFIKNEGERRSGRSYWEALLRTVGDIGKLQPKKFNSPDTVGRWLEDKGIEWVKEDVELWFPIVEQSVWRLSEVWIPTRKEPWMELLKREDLRYYCLTALARHSVEWCFEGLNFACEHYWRLGGYRWDGQVQAVLENLCALQLPLEVQLMIMQRWDELHPCLQSSIAKIVIKKEWKNEVPIAIPGA